MKLICLPYAGGSSAFYREWSDSLPREIVVRPVDFPGHGTRRYHSPLRDMQQLVSTLASELSADFRGPFALFGHSMGASVAFELCLQLRPEHSQYLTKLIVSGRSGPHVKRVRPPIYNLPHDEFILELKRLNGTPEALLQNKEMMELAAPILRADFELMDGYHPKLGKVLDCDVTAIGGDSDEDIDICDLEAWRGVTKGRFDVKLLSGDHFFIHSSREKLMNMLQEILLNPQNSE